MTGSMTCSRRAVLQSASGAVALPLIVLAASAKANPDKVNLASPGTGTAVHMAGEMFKLMTGASMTHVPYRGGAPAMADLISGQVQVMFDVLPGAMQHIRSGSIRVLAVTTRARV